MRAFVKKWFGKDATSENTFKMVRDVLLPELQRFKDHLLQVLALQRQEDLELLQTRPASTSKESTGPSQT